MRSAASEESYYPMDYRNGRYVALRTLFLGVLLFVLALSGCTIMYVGTKYDNSLANKVKIGETSRQDVEKLLGQPIHVTRKLHENIIIYTYKHGRTFGLAIPFIFSIGKTAATAEQVSIAFSASTDKVINIEFVHIDEKF